MLLSFSTRDLDELEQELLRSHRRKEHTDSLAFCHDVQCVNATVEIAWLRSELLMADSNNTSVNTTKKRNEKPPGS